MKPSFWHKVWERNSIGFHQNELHPFLEEVLKPLLSADDSSVFVPLCGKSLDMVWLAEYMQVIGNELSDIACRDFFIEKNLQPSVTVEDDFCLYQYDNITLYQGDFFALEANRFNTFDWVYDRAALIALPKEMQQRYVNHLTSFIQKNTKLIFVSLEFPEEEMSGPPFPILNTDLEKLFKGFNIECVYTHELADKRFAQRKFEVTSLLERAYIISRAN